MRLTFLGTKGFIEESSGRHKYHSSLLLEYKKFRLLIDHGQISKPLSKIKPDAILITHAHPDTFKWVKEKEDYPAKIYLSRESQKLAKYHGNFVAIKKNKKLKLGMFTILPYPVVHSINAPALGFKITAGGKSLVYNSDLIVMENKSILQRVKLYIGDGSSLRSNLVRRKGQQLFGHARMRTQINWCLNYGIKKVIFTHFGKEVIGCGDSEVKKLLKQKGIEIILAYDGMVYNL